MGQLAKQIAENSSGGFGANIEKNPKEECKAVMTISKREIIVENESKTSEEKEDRAEGEKENERDQMEERKTNEDEEEKNEKNIKNRDNEEEKKTKSELAREKKKEAMPNSGKDAPYPLVSSKKDKE